MIVYKDGSRHVSRDEWEHVIKPALETYIEGSEKLLAEEEIKSVQGTDKTNFEGEDRSSNSIKEVS